MTEQTKAATRLPMITAARVGYTKAKIQEMCIASKKKEFELFHVVGSAIKAAVKESKDYDDKESIEFGGSFMAIDCETGEQFKSGKLYLPAFVEGEIAAAVQNSGMVNLAVTITATYAEKAATSYAYGIKSYGPEDNSAFDAMLALIPGVGTKALSAPATDGEAGTKGKGKGKGKGK